MWEPWGAYSQVCLCEKKRKKEKKWIYFSFYFRFLSLEMNLIPPNKPHSAAAAAAKSLQLCPTLCDPIDSSPPGSPVPGILQARTLEWVAISFCDAWKWKAKVKLFSHVWLFATPWTAAHQAPPSMGFSRQEYWSGVPLHSPKETSRSWKRQRNRFFPRISRKEGSLADTMILTVRVWIQTCRTVR